MSLGFCFGCCGSGPPPVVVSCTGASIPQTLTLSYTHCHYNTPGPDTSESHSVSLVYDSGAGAWVAVQTDDVFPGAAIPNTCTRFEWRLSCGLSAGVYKWSLAYTVKNAAGSFTCQATATDLEDSASAGPLILTFTYTYSFYHGTCLGAGVVATVTE